MSEHSFRKRSGSPARLVLKRINIRSARVVTLSLLVGVSLLGLSLMIARPPVSRAAQATTLTVTSTADAGGSCPGANCTLRQAIATALNGDTINFSLPSNSVIDLTTRELAIDKNLTIKGPGANLLTVQRNPSAGNFRIFHTGATFVVTISGLTISNGATNSGAGVYNDGNLTITDSTISGNRATGSVGGGIYGASDTTTIINCTISGNFGSGGGGISNGLGAMTITNTTISGNTAGSEGGAIFTFFTPSAMGRITITNSTITGNSAPGFGGGIRIDGGHGGTLVTMKNTIIAGNTTGRSGPDFVGELTSQGYNLIGNDTGLSNLTPMATDQIGTAASPIEPILGPLQYNGGPTRTHALLAGSPAIDRGYSSGSNTDQRGFARPVDDPFIGNANDGDGADTGAYEIQADQLPACNVINRIVNNNNDSGTDSLRAVIANVCAGSTITFAPNVRGVINLTSGELLVNKSLTIAGPGANLLTVQRGASADNFRIFNLIPNSVIVTISGLTIANGNAPSNGGGISNTGTLTIANSTISGNRTGVSGGGIVSSRTLNIINTTISGNSATGGFGGGIYSTGALNINNSTITGNSANVVGLAIGSGGGIQNAGGAVTITNSTISSNTAQLTTPSGRGSLWNSPAGSSCWAPDYK